MWPAVGDAPRLSGFQDSQLGKAFGWNSTPPWRLLFVERETECRLGIL